MERPLRNDRREHLARRALRGDHAPAGLQTISPSYYEAASLDGASDWQQFRHVTLPLLTPIIAVVMTFSVLFTFTDFQLIYVLTRGGPLNATHLMATLSFQRAISGGSLARARPLPLRWCRSCSRQSCSATTGCSVARGSRADQINELPGMNDTTQAVAAPTSVDSTGMAYLDTRKRRIMTVYLPLAGFLFVLLFPFYWMAITTFKPNEELLSREGNPFWVRNPTLAHVKKLLFDTPYPSGSSTRCWWRWSRRSSRSCAACSRPTPSSACASRARATSA
jgi:hypothetical protein